LANTEFQNYLNLEYDRLIARIDSFRSLLPHPTRDAALHSGEEGRYLESIFETFLRERLPASCGVGTGFIVNTNSGVTSYQTDILVYDRMNYAPISDYGSAVVLPHPSVRMK